MTVYEFSQEQSTWMYITIAVGFLIPIICLVLAKVKKQIPIFPALAAGIVGFFFISNLKGIVELLLFNVLQITDTASLSKSNLLLRNLLDAIISAAFIWLSLIFAYRFLMKNYKTRVAGLSAAIGFAAVNMFSSAMNNVNVIMSVKNINSTGLDQIVENRVAEYVKNGQDVKFEDLYQLYVDELDTLMHTTVSQLIYIAVLMMLLFAIEVGACVIIFHAYQEKKTLGYTVALGAYLVRVFSYSIISNQIISVIIGFVIAVFLCYYAKVFYQKSELDEFTSVEEVKKEAFDSRYSRRESDGSKSIASIMKQANLAKANMNMKEVDDNLEAEEIETEVIDDEYLEAEEIEAEVIDDDNLEAEEIEAEAIDDDNLKEEMVNDTIEEEIEVKAFDDEKE